MGSVTLFTLYDKGFRAVGDLCAKSMRKHARDMRCDVVVYESLLDESIHPSWNKIPAALDLFEYLEEGDWCVWIDADCVVVRPFALVDDIEEKQQYDLLTSSDWNGICMGFFAIKKCQWSADLFKFLLICGDVRNDDDFGAGLGQKWEQNAVKALVNNFPKIDQRVSFLDKRWITDKPQQDTTLVYPVHHFGAMSNDARVRLMSKLIKQ